jgi:Flp pilus assembly protein TadB
MVSAEDDGERESLGERVSALEAELEATTVAREDLEAELRRYVRRRQRRGHARGWGPYLVLLYGTAMSIGAFYFLSGGWAILAMVVVWLSTLGLYVAFVLAGMGIAILDRVASIPTWISRRH